MSASSIKLLIVDDDEIVRWSLKKSIESREQYSVCSAGTVDEALKKISMNQYDVIITDWRLPDAEGLEILKNLKSSGKDTPVVVMSASLSEDIFKGLSSYGAIRYIAKPFHVEEIMIAVREAVRCKKEPGF